MVEFSVVNLLLVGGISFEKYFLNNLGYFFKVELVLVKMIFNFLNLFFILWYMIFDLYCVEVLVR